MYDGLQNSRHQRLVFHQRGTCIDFTNLLGRTTHVDVDNVRALVNVEARGLGHHGRRGAGYLHHDRIHFARVIATTNRFFGGPQPAIGCHHLAHRHARTQAFAEHAKWPIRHARHGGDDQIVREMNIADLQWMRLILRNAYCSNNGRSFYRQFTSAQNEFCTFEKYFLTN